MKATNLFLAPCFLFVLINAAGSSAHAQQPIPLYVKSADAPAPAGLLAVNDFTASPYTGYTRKHWLAIAEKIIAGEMAHFDKRTGMPLFHVPKEDSAFESVRLKNPEESGKRALERMMMAVIIYTKSTGKDTVPGYKGSISRPFINAIIRGTDPADSNYWGDPLPNDQVGAVFAIAAYLEPQRYWTPLTKVQQANLLSYFKKQVYISTYDNNHYFFHMVPVELLDINGYASNRVQLSRMYERLMGWYRGNGWFLDGNNRTFDYYNLWGFQLFNQVLYRFDPQWKKQFGDRIQQTTATFLQTMPYLFGHDGGPVPWGRSLAYRFAGNAAIAWATLNGMNTLPPGQARRIASGSLKYFWDHGCMDKDGLLSLGYWGANASVAENYLYYGDPYWANHGLAPLLIPENDPFWTSREEPIPADSGGAQIAITAAVLSIRISSIDGEARMFPAGQPLAKDRTMWQGGSKYDQHAYSSYLGFCVNGEDGEVLGAGRSGYSYDGIKWFYRERAKSLQVTADHLISSYTLKPPGDSDAIPDYNRDEMITHTLIGNDGEVHIFWHNHPDPVYLYLGGYGISVPKGMAATDHVRTNSVLINTKDYYTVLKGIQVPEGKFESILLTPRKGWSSTHLFGGSGVYPCWRSLKPVPPNTAVIFYCNGTKNRPPATGIVNIKRTADGLAVDFEGKTFTVHLPF